MLEGIRSIEDFDLKGKRVFLRLDLNVPLNQGEITDDTRIQGVLPTLKYALDKGAHLIVASHLGRPKSEEDFKSLSLQPVATRLGELLNVEVILTEDPKSEVPKAMAGSLKGNQIIMLENLRFDPRETKNEVSLAELFAEYTDIYINDAFGASHRAHASVVALPALVENKGVGFLIKREIEMLNQVHTGAEHPFVAVLGGAKVSDKIKVIDKLIEKVDSLIVGGAMAYTFLRAMDVNVGSSLVEKDRVKAAKDIIERFRVRGKNLLLPIDHRTVTAIDKPESVLNGETQEIEDNRIGVDIGEATEKLYEKEISGAKCVFWNGPMGIFETKEYSSGTFSVAKAIASLEGITIVGGGDSAAAAHLSGVAEKMTHISTGGGASLEYLQGDQLPGLESLKN